MPSKPVTVFGKLCCTRRKVGWRAPGRRRNLTERSFCQNSPQGQRTKVNLVFRLFLFWFVKKRKPGLQFAKRTVFRKNVTLRGGKTRPAGKLLGTEYFRGWRSAHKFPAPNFPKQRTNAYSMYSELTA